MELIYYTGSTSSGQTAMREETLEGSALLYYTFPATLFYGV